MQYSTYLCKREQKRPLIAWYACGHPLHTLSFLSLEGIIVTGIYGYTC